MKKLKISLTCIMLFFFAVAFSQIKRPSAPPPPPKIKNGKAWPPKISKPHRRHHSSKRSKSAKAQPPRIINGKLVLPKKPKPIVHGRLVKPPKPATPAVPAR